MESTALSSSGDAELILKLYELRRETTMRAARYWVSVEFKPESAEAVIEVLRDFGSQHNQYLRQVVSYWEMAAAFVLRGALDGELLVDCCTENMFLLAKFQPFLEQIRQNSPHFLVRTEQFVMKHAVARANVERMAKANESRRAVLVS
jgi:hypothetical protein